MAGWEVVKRIRKHECAMWRAVTRLVDELNSPNEPGDPVYSWDGKYCHDRHGETYAVIQETDEGGEVIYEFTATIWRKGGRYDFVACAVPDWADEDWRGLVDGDGTWWAVDSEWQKPIPWPEAEAA